MAELCLIQYWCFTPLSVVWYRLHKCGFIDWKGSRYVFQIIVLLVELNHDEIGKTNSRLSRQEMFKHDVYVRVNLIVEVF